jgi:hypothetical protein
MIKKLLSIASILLASHQLNAQAFNLVYEFSSVTATSGTVDPTPAPTAVGVTSGSFTANNLSANPTTTNVFAFTSWTTSTTPNLDKFFQLILTPQQNYFIELSHMSFYAGRSNTGPQKWSVRTNLDNYTQNAIATTSLINPASSGSIINVSGNNEFVWGAPPTNSATTSSAWRNNCQVNFVNANNIATPVNIRIYGYNGTSNAGSFRIDSVVVYGTATFSVGANLPKISHDLNASFKLYPNPSENGVVFLEPKKETAEETSIEVIDITGAVRAKESKIFVAKKVRLDLNYLSEGTYFVRFKNGNAIHTEKLIIVK